VNCCRSIYPFASGSDMPKLTGQHVWISEKSEAANHINATMLALWLLTVARTAPEVVEAQEALQKARIATRASVSAQGPERAIKYTVRPPAHCKSASFANSASLDFLTPKISPWPVDPAAQLIDRGKCPAQRPRGYRAMPKRAHSGPSTQKRLPTDAH
jgi:hypothetical protein